MTAEITLQEAAAQLGVHYMTVYRYVRLGMLPARKEGSTWRIDPADLELVRNQHDQRAPARRGPRPAGGRRSGHWAERFEARIVAGDAPGALGVAESALASGADLEHLYLDVVTPALRSVGKRWESGELDVADEHRASGVVAEVLHRLAPRFTRRGRPRGTVLLGAAPGEQHGLPVVLLADLLRAAGFAVDYLGPDLPAASFARAAEKASRLVAVGVSATTAEPAAVAEVVAAVRAAVPRIPILVGGAAIADEAAAEALGADGYAADGRGAVALVARFAAAR